MPDTLTLTDDQLIESFENCTLAAGSFRHVDHVRLAWLYLHRYSVTDAIERLTTGLKRFTKAVGAQGKYHETITWMFLILTHQRMQQMSGPHNWERFAAMNHDLFEHGVRILDDYYNNSTLQTDFARRVFVLPDKSHAVARV